MKNGKIQYARNRVGSAIVEMAIVLALLLNLGFGMVEFGRYYYVKNLMLNAAREGARAGAVPGATNSSVTAAVNNAMSCYNFWGGGGYIPPVPSGSWSTAVSDSTGNNNVANDPQGSTITVTVTATWGTIGAGFRPLSLIGSSKTMAASFSMLHE
jgi:Flp pilus assembly protein TadG